MTSKCKCRNRGAAWEVQCKAIWSHNGCHTLHEELKAGPNQPMASFQFVTYRGILGRRIIPVSVPQNVVTVANNKDKVATIIHGSKVDRMPLFQCLQLNSFLTKTSHRPLFCVKVTPMSQVVLVLDVQYFMPYRDFNKCQASMTLKDRKKYCSQTLS